MLFLQCAAETAHSGGMGIAWGLDTVNQLFRPSQVLSFPLKETVLCNYVCKFTQQLFLLQTAAAFLHMKNA